MIMIQENFFFFFCRLQEFHRPSAGWNHEGSYRFQLGVDLHRWFLLRNDSHHGGVHDVGVPVRERVSNPRTLKEKETLNLKCYCVI